jgi:hypothetical protein
LTGKIRILTERPVPGARIFRLLPDKMLPDMRILLLLLVVFASNSSMAQVDLPFIRGVYGDPEVLLRQGHDFRELGINAVFARLGSVNSNLIEAAGRDGVRVFAEFPTLNGKEYLAQHPEAWPIDRHGMRSEPADWFMGICPTDPGFRADRKAVLGQFLRDFRVDGIWLDYLHWHAQFETPEPILPETCFCDRCIGLFSTSCGCRVPEGNTVEKADWILQHADGAWRKWRSQVLAGWVSELSGILKNEQPEALLGLYYCPWYPDEYDSALYRILGLELELLAGLADVFSPMIYHTRMGRPAGWVGEHIRWLGSQPWMTGGAKPRIWPIVQAYNQPTFISPEEFGEVMRQGSQTPATGIMMFSINSLATEPDKLEVMRRLYLEELR